VEHLGDWGAGPLFPPLSNTMPNRIGFPLWFVEVEEDVLGMLGEETSRVGLVVT
jgi:hypothetical protein